MSGISSITVSKGSLLAGLGHVIRHLETISDGFAMSISGRTVGQPDTVAKLTHREIEDILANLGDLKSSTDTSFIWADRAEFTIVPLNNHASFERSFDGAEFKGQGDNPISYEVGPPSKEVVAYLLCLIGENPALRATRKWGMIRMRIRRIAESFVRDSDGPLSLLDLVGEIFYAVTLRIESREGGLDYENLANSFLFHAAYNMDLAARIGTDPLFVTSKIQRVRRVTGAAFDPPRQTYSSDLIQHYLMGVAAEIPLLEYLSYYHVAEHYFEKVFNDDLVEQVRKGITDPSFSARRARKTSKP
ncbi:hypothetical protein [Streptomyces sp. NPDC017940]|uniref:hypothetical protein n=1 Tax=Streptomyces sp. NPDC017940 TaxID=3365017 RepID=UPI0037B7E71F